MTRLVNLGCKLNQYEGHCLLEHFKNVANLNIVNTCVVTKEAERKSLKKIRQILNTRTDSLVVVSGCLMETMNLDLKGVDIIIRQRDRNKIVDQILPCPDQARYFLKIQDGCNARCSFCIVPLVRGSCFSVPKDRIVREIMHARDLKYPEIVLTGVNVGAYGCDNGSSLTELLKSIIGIPSRPRLRLSSLEPQYLNFGLIELFNELHLCHHLHLPIQSGDQGVLQAMNRHYDIDCVRARMNEMVACQPEFNFGADIIAGFPAEDRAAFDRTYDFIKSAPFAYLHVFPYSPRPGTEAQAMGDPVSQEEKRWRVNVLRQLSREKSEGFRKRFVGKKFTVTVEEKRGIYFGLTGNYLRIKLTSQPLTSLVNIKISKVVGEETIGDIV